MLAGVVSLSVVLLGQFCPFPTPPDCHLQYDINCDGRDHRHCQPYDIDTILGDCVADGVADDFWTFFDGDEDGFVDPCSGSDSVLLQPDGAPDGVFWNPSCDHWSEDRAQGGGLGAVLLQVLDATTVAVLSDSFVREFDLVRGNVSQLSFGAASVDLGEVVCLAENVSLPFGSDFVPIADAIPPTGEIWFYTARWTGGSYAPGIFYPYGYGECLERIVPPGSGDCER